MRGGMPAGPRWASAEAARWPTRSGPAATPGYAEAAGDGFSIARWPSSLARRSTPGRSMLRCAACGRESSRGILQQMGGANATRPTGPATGANLPSGISPRPESIVAWRSRTPIEESGSGAPSRARPPLPPATHGPAGRDQSPRERFPVQSLLGARSAGDPPGAKTYVVATGNRRFDLVCVPLVLVTSRVPASIRALARGHRSPLEL